MAESIRSSTARWFYLIVGLYLAIIFSLIIFFRLELDALTAIRVYAGGEAFWAKAQKNAVLCLNDYVASHDEADYRSFLNFIQIPLGDRKMRIELQKPNPDLDAARGGFVLGGNHPDDSQYAIPFFVRFQHDAHFAKVIQHWTQGDQLILELQGIGEDLHGEIVSGRFSSDAMKNLQARLRALNRRLTEQENQFASALAEGSRWANDVCRRLTYLIAFLFSALGAGLSWPIIRRIKATENAFFASEKRCRKIFEHANDIIYVIEPDATLSSISPSFTRLMGWQPEEWLGRPFYPIIHPDDLPHMQELFAMAMRGESLPIFNVRLLMKSGSYLDSEIATALVGRPGSISILGVVRDITERKRMEDQIRRLNEELEAKVAERTQQLLEAQQELVNREKLALLGQLAASVGNELRNPLGVMSNAAFFLQNRLTDADDTTREYLGIIQDEIAGAETIVSDFLDATSSKPPRPKSVDIAELLGQALSRCTIPYIVTVRLDIPRTIARIRVDPAQMQRVFRNLIANSVAAMPAGGLLEIRASENKESGTVTVSVRDTGSGIAQENLDKLFQPLFTTKARGIGLGLVVVKNLTRANNGTIEVESVAGRGATFSVILPVCGDDGMLAKQARRENEDIGRR